MIDLQSLSAEKFQKKKEQLRELKNRLITFSRKAREFSTYLEEIEDIDKQLKSL